MSNYPVKFEYRRVRVNYRVHPQLLKCTDSIVAAAGYRYNTGEDAVSMLRAFFYEIAEHGDAAEAFYEFLKENLTPETVWGIVHPEKETD